MNDDSRHRIIEPCSGWDTVREVCIHGLKDGGRMEGMYICEGGQPLSKVCANMFIPKVLVTPPCIVED